MEEKQEDQHIRLDVEERAQNFKGPHHGPTIWVELKMSHIQILKQSTLEDNQGENKPQDLKQALIHKKEGWTA